MNAESVNLRYEISKYIQSLPKPEPKEVKHIPLCEKQLWRKYKRLVWKITEKQRLNRLPNYEKRGSHGYHLDHKVSIWYGYKHKLDPYMIGGIDNLEFIPWKENFRKGIKCNFPERFEPQMILFV